MFSRINIFLLFFGIFFQSRILFSQQCVSTSKYPFEWPSHKNWYIGNYGAGIGSTGYMLNLETLEPTNLGGNRSEGVGSYEGVTTASDDDGNLLFYSNGRSMFTGIGTFVVKTYGGLLSGNEGVNTVSSSLQGIITVRHPLNPLDYHVFTVDDAVGPTNGLNHFVFDKEGHLKDGPIQLTDSKTTEGIAATRHNNGLDIWVTVMTTNGKYHSFLLTPNGVDTLNSNLNQNGGSTVSGDNERGGLAFSWDGKTFASAHHQNWPNMDKSLMIYDFNNETGEISNGLAVASTAQLWIPRDLLFSPDNNRIFFTSYGRSAGFVDISPRSRDEIINSYTPFGDITYNAALEIGIGGELYIGGSSGLKRVIGDLNTDTSFEIDTFLNSTSNGLPTMYLPPAEYPQIMDLNKEVICESDESIDLQTNWACLATDAEAYYHEYIGEGITDSEEGIFNPSIAGVGPHVVIFNTGSVSDTIEIEVVDAVTCIRVGKEEVGDKLKCIQVGNTLSLIGSVPTDLSLMITNYNGQVIAINSFDKSNIDLSEMNAGMYNVKAINGSEILFQKNVLVVK